jgi:hypothetical protein
MATKTKARRTGGAKVARAEAVPIGRLVTVTPAVVRMQTACERLGRWREAVYRMVMAGDIDIAMIDGRQYVTIESIDRYIAEHGRGEAWQGE